MKIKTPLAQEAGKLCRTKRKAGRPHRALRPFGDDALLLQVINRLEFAITGFHNRDIRHALYSDPCSKTLQRKQTAAVSRKLALLRAHGLIRKVPGRHLYHVSPKGRQVITALLTARQASIEELTKLAA